MKTGVLLSPRTEAAPLSICISAILSANLSEATEWDFICTNAINHGWQIVNGNAKSAFGEWLVSSLSAIHEFSR